MGSDDHPAWFRVHRPCFNPRSRMGSDGDIETSDGISLSFNPRSRMGSDIIDAKTKQGQYVSIHAPAWGATGAGCDINRLSSCFNPRSRMGSDLGVRRGAHSGRVSIHAPAWGATRPTLLLVALPRFQSTLPHGERQLIIQHVAIPFEFQSTLPHGERQKV